MLTPPEHQDIVIVGASGDLASRKLIPALYNLFLEGALPEVCTIIGAAIMEWDRETFVEHAHEAVASFSRTPLEESQFRKFAKHLTFIPLSEHGGMEKVRAACEAPKRLMYLAIPPGAIVPVVHELEQAHLVEGTSLVIEKPFGFDLATAKELNRTIEEVFPREQIYRIDHYLGKETVQNLLVFRFGNALFERIWNRDSIHHVEITVGESLGVEHRGAFYESVGALRDIVQNHLLQVVSFIAMEPPASFTAESMFYEQYKVFQAMEPLDPAQVIRGQYGPGMLNGEKVPGYREEPGVASDSLTETYIAATLHVDTWRWAGVPFYIRTGKRLARQDSRVVIVFKDVPLNVFRGTEVEEVKKNFVTIRLQPHEGISLAFSAKLPGPSIQIDPVTMDFSYARAFKGTPPEAYERLLHDALVHDHTLFIATDIVERAWEVVQGVIDHPSPVILYPSGSWGPEEANAMMPSAHWHMEESEE